MVSTTRKAAARVAGGGLACLLALANAHGGTGAMLIQSERFKPMGAIPQAHTCEGADISPPLAWTEVPVGTQSFVLIVDDPDAPDPNAPKTVWVHWVLYDIPADARVLPEGVASGDLPPGTREGRNDWKRTGYGGPCPPIGRHRYFFKLYALDKALGDLGPATKATIEGAMAGHILAQAQVIGTYEKGR